MQLMIEYFKKDKYRINLAICFVVALILLSLPILMLQFKQANVSHVNNIYSVKATKSVQDKVVLKDNDIFQSTNGYYSNDFYVVDMISNFHIQYYDTLYLTGVEEIDLSATQIIYADLVVESAEGEILKEAQSVQAPGYVSRKETIYTTTQSVIDLNEKVEMNYKTFQTRFGEIKNKLPGVDCYGYIKIRYIVRCNGTIDGEVFNYQEILTSQMPILTAGTLGISHTIPAVMETEKDIVTYSNEINAAWLSLGILMDVIAIILLVIVIIAIVQLSQQNKKQKQVNKLLSEYNDIIIFAEHMVELKNSQLLRVASFNDMVKAEVELSTPIVCVEEKGQYHFYLYNKWVTYYYTVNVNEDQEQTEVAMIVDKKDSTDQQEKR